MNAQTIATALPWFWLSLCALAFGSFATVLVYRLPLRILDAPTPWVRFNLAVPRSHCPQCAMPLRWWHNIPLISFMLLRARCSFCRASIGWRYFWIEWGVLLLAWACVGYFGWQREALFAAVFLYVLWVLVWIDGLHFLLPDVLTYPLVLLGLAGCALLYPLRFMDASWGAVLGFLLLWLPLYGYLRWRGIVGLGLGDCKLMAGVGAWLSAWLGMGVMPYVVLCASVLAIVYFLVRMFCTRTDEQLNIHTVKIPFAPFIGGATVLVAWFYKQSL